MRGWLLVPGLVAVAAGCAVFDGDAELWLRLRGELADARGRIATLHEQVRELERDVAALEADPFAIESAIREDLGLARAGETLLLWTPTGPRKDASNARIP